MVLLRKSIPQNHNLKSAAELAVRNRMNKLRAMFAAIILCASVCAFAKQIPISQEFEADQITKVIIRAGSITDGTVVKQSKSPTIKISAIPSGGTKGYHPADKNWKETPAKEWGLAFEAKKFGTILVISSKNEIAYIHHHYWLANVEIEVPSGVQVILSPREVSGKGEPDLSEPNS